MTFKLDEIFYSIQGEGTDVGLPCVFIRFFGCPIKCVYCDQPQKKFEVVSEEDIINEVNTYKSNYGVNHICITGGEPLIQKGVVELARHLTFEGFEVSIETSGCVTISDTDIYRSFKYVMDIKCPCSGVVEKNKYENLLFLKYFDEVKFVIKDRTDYDFMKAVLMKYPTSAKILVSPMFDNNMKASIGSTLVNWILEDSLDVRVQIQLHKILDVK